MFALEGWLLDSSARAYSLTIRYSANDGDPSRAILPGFEFSRYLPIRYIVHLKNESELWGDIEKRLQSLEQSCITAFRQRGIVPPIDEIRATLGSEPPTPIGAKWRESAEALVAATEWENDYEES